MEINSKKIYLSIILVLFILFSFLFIPCCKVFALGSNDVIDYVVANYNLTRSDFDAYISKGDRFYLIEPGGWIKVFGGTDFADGLKIFSHGDENEPYCTYLRERRNTASGYSDYHQLEPYSSHVNTFPSFHLWSYYEFNNSHPLLIKLTGPTIGIDFSESFGTSLIYGPSTLNISIDMDRSSKEANVPGSIIGNVTGSFLDQLEPGGRLKLVLSKNVGNKFSFVTQLIDTVVNEEDLVDGSFNFEFSCPALELGHYVLAAHYETDTIELDDMTGFVIDRDVNDIDKFINIDGKEYKTDDYFGKVFWFTYPEHNKLYFGNKEGTEIYYLRGSEDYFSENIFGKYSFNENFPIAEQGEFDLKINVFINDYLLEERDISSRLVATNNISASLLNRGRNTAYITSSTCRDERDDIYNYKIGDKYYYLYDALDFYYKTTEGSGDVEVTVPDRESGGRDGDPWPGPGSGGIGSGVGGSGGLTIGSPPNRSDYPDDILGTLNYFIDWIAYIISIPINLLISAFDWLVNVFTSLFYWVGQLSGIIGGWFNFLPIEVRALLMATFVSSIVAFVLRLFRK